MVFGYVSAQEATTQVEKKSNLTVTLKTGTGVENREIVGEAASFSATVGKVYCWGLVKGAQTETNVTIEWYYNGKKLREIPLSVKYSSTRTWCWKNISPGQVGNWTIKVLDAKGIEIGSAVFEIK